VIWLIEELLRKFEHSPDLSRLLVANTEVLIQANMLKEAKEFVEFCVTGELWTFCRTLIIVVTQTDKLNAHSLILLNLCTVYVYVYKLV